MECSICLLPMSDNKVKLLCGHFLHGQCFVNYVLVQHKGVTCPLCRESCVFENLSDSSESSDYAEEETTISLRAARAHARFDTVLKRMFETRHKWIKETKRTQKEFTRLRKLLHLKDAQFEAEMKIMKHNTQEDFW